MLWCEGAQNIGLSNRELKSALNALYDHNARLSRTDGHQANSATIRSTNASRANKIAFLKQD